MKEKYSYKQGIKFLELTVQRNIALYSHYTISIYQSSCLYKKQPEWHYTHLFIVIFMLLCSTFTEHMEHTSFSPQKPLITILDKQGSFFLSWGSSHFGNFTNHCLWRPFDCFVWVPSGFPSFFAPLKKKNKPVGGWTTFFFLQGVNMCILSHPGSISMYFQYSWDDYRYTAAFCYWI